MAEVTAVAPGSTTRRASFVRGVQGSPVGQAISVSACMCVWQALWTVSQPKAQASTSTFLYTTSSLMDLMAWNATDDIELIDQPLLMIAGSNAQTLYLTLDAFPKATNAKSKELFLIEGATHIETYWKPEYVNQAVNKLVDFYQNHLSTTDL